jgi:hypothetical protein
MAMHRLSTTSFTKRHQTVKLTGKHALSISLAIIVIHHKLPYSSIMVEPHRKIDIYVHIVTKRSLGFKIFMNEKRTMKNVGLYIPESILNYGMSKRYRQRRLF